MNHSHFSLGKITSITVITSFALLIAYLSYSYVWLGDEIFYQFSYKDGTHISSISDIIQSQNAHYMSVNGRYVAHCLVQLFNGLIGRQLIFSIANGCVYILFISLILNLSKISLSQTKTITTIVLMLFISMSTLYGPSCQIGYMWMFSLSLLFIRLFFASIKNKAYTLLLIPFSIIAGNSHEAICIGISAAMISYVIRNWKQLSFNQWAMFFSYGLGALFLCLAPGTLKRALATESSFVGNSFMLTSYHLIYLMITTVMCIYLLFAIIKHKISFTKFYRQNAFTFNILITLLIFNLIIGISTNRQVFGVELMAMFIIIKLHRLIGLPNFIRVSAIPLLAIIATIIIVRDYNNSQYNRKVYNNIKEQFTKNPDGKTYYDLDSDAGSFYPAVIGSMQQLWNYEQNNSSKKLSILPTCLHNIDTLKIGRYSFQNAKGSTIVVVDKRDLPKRIIVSRNYGFKYFKATSIN